MTENVKDQIQGFLVLMRSHINSLESALEDEDEKELFDRAQTLETTAKELRDHIWDNSAAHQELVEKYGERGERSGCSPS